MQQQLFPLLFIFILFLGGCSQDKNPKERTIIIDDAHILTDKAGLIQSYKEYNEQLLKDYRIDFRVITTQSDTGINDFSNRAFALFTQEETTQSGRALLLVINTEQDLARLEVSMALEPVYTDAFISFIEGQHMVHFFRDNRMAEGIFATTERIYMRAREAAEGQEFMADMPSKSLGGGAKVKSEKGNKELNVKSTQNVAITSADTPEIVLEKYIQSRREHNDNPNLALYTDETKSFFNSWTVTPVQMDNEVRSFSACYDSETLISKNHDFAVILFPLTQRKCSPYLFKKESGSWKLDFATMNKLIRFNHEMKWHLLLGWKENMKQQEHAYLTQKDLVPDNVTALLAPYLFAFVDFIYDVNGYAFNTWGKAVFGVRFNEYHDDQKQYSGTFIVALHSRGAGLKHGLKEGDRILEVAGKTIKQGDLDFISQRMREKRSGEELKIKIGRWNDGERVTHEIVMTAP